MQLCNFVLGIVFITVLHCIVLHCIALYFIAPSGVRRIQSMIQGGPKTGLFLRVDNFAAVGDRNACDMSKFSN